MSNAIDKADVLIVGAGPTGLVLAIELARRNVSLRIIDRKLQAAHTSRSFTIHARTMELFDDMGVADKFLQQGYKLNGFVFNFQGQSERPKLHFEQLDTRFPFILSLGQTETERILREHLAHEYDVHIDWGTELLRLESNADDDMYSAVIRETNGMEKVSSAKWIIGCDGLNSLVRMGAGLGFEGDAYEGTVMQLMDAPVSGFDWAEDAVHYYMSKDRFLLLARLPNDFYRVIVSFKGNIDDNDREKARELFQDVTDSLVDDVKLGVPLWVSKWSVWKKHATRYMHKNVLLVGDSAHVHSPSGGQGMNCGMQDAYNLGWKLAMVLSAHCSQHILKTYESERRAIGTQVIDGADAIHNILMAHGKQLTERIKVTQQDSWRSDAVQRISGLSYHYGAPNATAAQLSSGPLSAGQHVPNVQLRDVYLHELLRGPRFTLLLVHVAKGECAELVREARGALPALLKVVAVIDGTDGDENHDIDTRCSADCTVLCEHSVLAARLQVARATALLVRPDGYLAARAAMPEGDEVQLYLRRLLAGTAA